MNMHYLKQKSYRLKQKINILNILLQSEFDSHDFISRKLEDYFQFGNESDTDDLCRMLNHLEDCLEKRYYYVHVNNSNERIYEFYCFKNTYLLETVWIINGIIREFKLYSSENLKLQELQQTLKRICRNTHFNDPIYKKDTYASFKIAKAYSVYKKIINYAKVIPYATSKAIYRKFKKY